MCGLIRLNSLFSFFAYLRLNLSSSCSWTVCHCTHSSPSSVSCALWCFRFLISDAVISSSIRASDLAAKLSLSRKPIEQVVKQLIEKRNTYEARWKAIRAYQLPYVGVFDGVDDETNAGNRKDTNVWHNCAWDSNQIFAAGVMGGLTPPSRKWFRLDFADTELKDNSELGRILDERIDILADVLEKSNFYTAVHSCYLELAFGQAPLGIFPDHQYGVHFLAQCYSLSLPIDLHFLFHSLSVQMH